MWLHGDAMTIERETKMEVSPIHGQTIYRKREELSKYDSESTKGDLLGVIGLSLQDKGWISLPDSIYSSSFEFGITSGGTSLPDLNNPIELMGQHSHGEEEYQPSSIPSSHTGFQSHSWPLDVDDSDNGSVKSSINEPNANLEAVKSQSDEATSVPVGSSQPLNKESEVTFGVEDKLSLLSKVKIDKENDEDPIPNARTISRVARGKYEIFLYLEY
ncbi:hypothetical protein Patl1_32988 [Pistacia atlantica]|uniref:Uncharacterized protein n=1 Tax=Pistacia atlantica TaxID=434234 RepID=A0ACC1AMB4_9ROSI|nr:hypothetical protein Patl1_32988 [Pistacia atlantica]